MRSLILKFLVGLAIIFICFIFLISCAKRINEEKKVVKINNYTLTVDEFNALYSELGFAEDTIESKKLFLENLINRKLLLQEAQRMGLDKKKEFLRTIENFWEKSLLKIVIDEKARELYSDLTLDEKQIDEAYTQWLKDNSEVVVNPAEQRELIKKKVLRQKQSSMLNNWINGLKTQSDIEVDKETLGV